MEENKERNCWFPILLGLLGLALLFLLANFFGKGRASNLTKRATEVAQEALIKNQYSFASVEVGGPLNANLIVKGAAIDQATKLAACESAKKALVEKKMIGLPGVVASVQCEITAPGDNQTLIAKAVDTKPSNNAAADTCQADLNAAATSGSVQFAKSGSSTIAGQEVLEKVAEIAKKCSKFKIEVAGHTDTGGDENMNMALSQERANSVRNFLISKGVSADQLSAKGYGETKPLVQDNAVIGVDNPERQKNRRIEFNITTN